PAKRDGCQDPRRAASPPRSTRELGHARSGPRSLAASPPIVSLIQRCAGCGPAARQRRGQWGGRAPDAHL
uniref:Uncharacterized protein n=1 Tax=Aegilops tauschii subsp. strangulata TaxID=200361 RepID=A0A453GD67_AEGTS